MFWVWVWPPKRFCWFLQVSAAQLIQSQFCVSFSTCVESVWWHPSAALTVYVCVNTACMVTWLAIMEAAVWPTQSVISKPTLNWWLNKQCLLPDGLLDSGSVTRKWKKCCANLVKVALLCQMSKLAEKYLCIRATSAASAAFSVSGSILSAHRSCLKPEDVDVGLCFSSSERGYGSSTW